MSPQEENRIYGEMNAMNAKLDILMPVVTEVRGIKDHLATLNGSVAKNKERINDHETKFAAVLERMTNFFENAQEIKMMNLPRMVERVDWMYRFFWVMAGGVLTTLIGLAFTYFSK